MTKIKYLLVILFIILLLIVLPNISNANTDIDVTRNIYSNDGSMKFSFTGLTLDMTHEYQYGITKIAASEVTDWYLVTEYTQTSATVAIMTGTKQMRDVVNAVDIGYITIKDKTTDTIILQPYAVDLKLPYFNVTNYTVISNGHKLDGEGEINVPLRNASNSIPYYQYEKITDPNIINKYKEIKANNGDFTTLQDILKTTPPNQNWSSWGYWNGHGGDGINGYGFTQRYAEAPDTGLYYMWVYFSGESIKNLYGYILVDNLEPEIALEGISLPTTKTVELGKTLNLSPTFNPVTATNKIVTWTSSDETVATVDNAGKITPKKVGSTIITVTSQDGNKKATCTVTVTEATTNNPGTTNSNNGSGTITGNKDQNKNDTTTAPGKLPQTGLGISLILTIIILIGGSIFIYSKLNKYKGI